jgi:hypothetical protein
VVNKDENEGAVRKHYIDSIQYTEKGKYSRDGGPALIYKGGSEYWIKDGKLFRKDGPCSIYPDGSAIWDQQSDGSCFMENERGDEVWRSKEKLP